MNPAKPSLPKRRGSGLIFSQEVSSPALRRFGSTKRPHMICPPLLTGTMRRMPDGAALVVARPVAPASIWSGMGAMMQEAGIEAQCHSPQKMTRGDRDYNEGNRGMLQGLLPRAFVTRGVTLDRIRRSPLAGAFS